MKKLKHILRFTLFLIPFTLYLTTAFSQGTAINTTGADPHASAVLDVSSTSQGILIPRMTAAQKAAIASPAIGLMIYQTDGTAGFYYYNGSTWVQVGVGGSSLWMQNGTDINYVDGKVGVGEGNPAGVLHVSEPGAWLGITFTGSGLNDLTVNRSGYTGTGATNYAVKVENAGPNPNIILYSSDGGNTWSGYTPISSNLNVGSGVTINFTNTFGHTYGNRWDFTVNQSFSDIMIVKNGHVGIGTTSPAEELHIVGNLRVDDGSQQAGYVMASDASGTASWTDLTTLVDGSGIKDSDNDTKIQTEESPDEDLIRFDLGSTERWVMKGSRIEPANSGSSVFIGKGAGASDDLVDNYNVFIGDSSGYKNTSGIENIAIGNFALYNNKANNRSTAIGFGAMYYADSRTTGRETYNTAIGYQALYGSLTAANNTGTFNTAIGDQALFSNTSGWENTANGMNSLYSNTTGYTNTANGALSLYTNTTGNSNTAIGDQVLYSNTSGSENIAMGRLALYTNQANSRSTAIGYHAMYYADNRTTGRETYNTAIGYRALHGSLYSSTNTGTNNTAIGDQAMFSNTSGFENSANGMNTLYANTTGNDNTAHGAYSLTANTTGINNTANGAYSLNYNTTGNNNTASGNNALYTNVAGNYSTAIGVNAMYYANSSAASINTYNVAVGYEALRGSTTAANNTGTHNTAIGTQAMYYAQSGILNTAVGFQAGYIVTWGNFNVFVGDSAGRGCTSGHENVFIGRKAALTNTSGKNNTIIGSEAGLGTATLINATAIGSDASVSASNKVRLGSSSVTVVEGQVAYTFPSDARFKENVKEDVQGLDFIMKLHPVSYNFDRLSFAKHIKENTEGRESELQELSDKRTVGFIAQDIDSLVKATDFEAFDAVHSPTNENDNYSLSYSHFVIPLVKAVQELNEKLEKLQQENNELKALIKK